MEKNSDFILADLTGYTAMTICMAVLLLLSD